MAYNNVDDGPTSLSISERVPHANVYLFFLDSSSYGLRGVHFFLLPVLYLVIEAGFVRLQAVC